MRGGGGGGGIEDQRAEKVEEEERAPLHSPRVPNLQTSSWIRSLLLRMQSWGDALTPNEIYSYDFETRRLIRRSTGAGRRRITRQFFANAEGARRFAAPSARYTSNDCKVDLVITTATIHNENTHYFQHYCYTE